jgi:hypothetical protein
MWRTLQGRGAEHSSDLPVGRSRGRQQPTHTIYGDGISEKIKLFPPSPPPQSIYPHPYSSSICLSVISSFLLALSSSADVCMYRHGFVSTLSRYVASLFFVSSIFISISFHFHYFFVLSVFDDSSSELPFLIALFLSLLPLSSSFTTFPFHHVSFFWSFSTRNLSSVVYRTPTAISIITPSDKTKER